MFNMKYITQVMATPHILFWGSHVQYH